jgi:hypothetical protein
VLQHKGDQAMLRIYHAGREYAHHTIVIWRPSWRVVVPLVFAGDVAVAAIAWVVVGLVMR